MNKKIKLSKKIITPVATAIIATGVIDATDEIIKFEEKTPANQQLTQSEFIHTVF